MKLYDYSDSGNGYKVRLALAQLGVEYVFQEVDILRGESRTPEFLERNPNGRIPVLELDDGDVLCESSAILFYLADGSKLLPQGRLERARVLQWMAFEQYSHEPYIATSRFWLRHRELNDEVRALLESRREGGHAALQVMERHLGAHDWFAAGAYSIADIALYAYTHVADQGGFDLADYPAVRAWLGRVEGTDGFVPANFPA